MNTGIAGAKPIDDRTGSVPAKLGGIGSPITDPDTALTTVTGAGVGNEDKLEEFEPTIIAGSVGPELRVGLE